MTGDLEITVDPDSSDEKAAALILEGRRTTATESCATVSFRNENVTEDNTNGYLTYRSFGSNQSFKFNKDLRIEGNVIASNELRGTVLNSAKDSNLSIQRDNETKILVGSDAVQVQRPIKFVNSSFATADDHAIHKGYVDEQIANIDTGGGISGDCLEINGGNLCANGPMPDFIDLVKNHKIVLHRTGLNTSNSAGEYLTLDAKRGVRYIVKSGSNDISQIPLAAGTDWSQATPTGLKSYDYSDNMSVSPQGTYLVLGRFTHKVGGNYTWAEWQLEIARTSDGKTASSSESPSSTVGNITINGNISWWSETEFVCTGWCHSSNSSSVYRHCHIYGIISTNNNGDPVLTTYKRDNGSVTGIYDQTTSSAFHTIYTANDQILMTTGQSGKIWRMKSFNRSYSDWEEAVEFIYAERAKFITYISELERYYYVSNSGKAYLSQPSTDPLSDKTFINAVIFDFPAHVFSNNTTYSYYPKISGYPPLVYGTQLIVPSSWHVSRTIDGSDEWTYRG